MSVLRLEMRSDGPSPRKIAKAASIIHDGGVAAYPTDSVYALGCAVESRRGVERIRRAKQMNPKQHLAILFPDLSTASRYGRFTRAAYRLAKRIFPGPYTMVVPATSEVPRNLLDKKQRTIGIRIPSHPITIALVEELGRPLLTSTAQLPDQESPCSDADQVLQHFAKELDVLVDGGHSQSQPSTVLELNARDEIVILRTGAGSIEQLVAD